MLKYLVCFIFFSSSANAIEILRFSPSGKDINYQKQIALSFSKEMVPLGNMDVDPKLLPIQISPKLKCQWQWIDQKNLACQLDEVLPKATEFKILVNKKMSSYKGEKLDKDYSYSFETIRPKVTYISAKSFQYWTSPLRPILNINFNMPVLRESLISAIKFNHSAGFEVIPRKDNGCQEDICQYWEVFITGDLKRNSEYLLTIEKGIQAASGKLKSTVKKIQKIETAPYFRIEKVVCLFSNGSGYGDDQKEYILNYKDKNDFSTEQNCEPHKNKFVYFTLPVIPKSNYMKIVISPNPAGDSNINPFSNVYGFSGDYPSSSLYLPDILKSKQTYQFDFSKVENVFGEKLSGATNFSLAFKPRTPAVITKYDQAIIEKGIGNDIPILVTNMKNITVVYNLWNASGLKENLSKVIKIPYVEDVSFNIPLGLNELVEGDSGAITYSIVEQPKSNYSENVIFNQQSAHQVFIKLGHFNSYVWVLGLASGEAIKNASVTISEFGGKKQIGDSYQTDSEGKAKLPGLVELSPDLKIIDGSYYGNSNPYYISVKKNKDIAIVPLSYRYFAGSWESAIYPYLRKRYGHLKSWGLTPQGVYKPGSDIQYKIFIRNESLDSITLPPKDLTYGITILDPTGKVFKEIKSIKLTEFGTYAGTLQTSKLFPSGEYHAYITIDDNGDINKINSFNFIVADFTPSPFKSLTNLNKKSYQKGDNLIVEGAAQMHSGGAYTGNDARIIVNLTAKRFQPSNSKYKSFDFDDANYSDQNIAISNTTEKLNQTGQREIKLKLDHEIPNGTLFVETAVRDDRGKFISSRSVAEYFGQDKFLGGKLDKWSYRVGDDVEINHVVLDSNSALFKKSKVEVEVFWESVTAAKVKSSGNAYITKYNRSWESVHKCEIIIKDEDENICEFEPKKPGYYKVMSKIANGKSQWSESFYVVGSGQFLWGGDDTDHLTLVSENESVKIKDNVKVLVKNPFPKAKALITIERYGILDQWIEDIDESAHMLEFKIKPDYLPGFYVSVNLFSHRASESKGFGKLDLGKPSMKTGYLKFEVKDDYKVIDIDINSNKKEYYPGESVELEFEAEAKNGKLADVEIAIAVIDESVFDLIRGGETYFDPYKGLFELDSLDVQTFSLIKNLIGKQKFEKKGANQGGDGGGPSKVRSFIDYLAYWNPSVELKNGEGKIQFKLPDNLTGWKVLAIATDKADRMGLSTSRFISNLPTEIRAALPNQLIEGDQFKARFTVMNREDKKRTLNIEMQVNGVVEGDENQRNQKASLILEPGERKYVEMNIDVGKVKALRSNEKGELRFLVKAGDSIHQDIFTKIISVDKKRPSSVATTYGKILENSQELIDIKFPNDIYTDIGGLEVTGTTTLLGQLEDGFRYLKDYPYQCWEQKISKAVGAAQFIKLNHYFKDKLLWKDADKLVKQTIKEAANFQLKNGAMSYYGKYESAYLSAFTLNAFAWLESYGYTIPEKIKDQLIDFNKKLLKERLFSKYWNLNMRSTTRAISLAGLSEFGVLKPEELSRFWPRFENMSKFGQFHFYQAAINLRSSLSNDSLEKLLGSLIVDAGKVRFNEVKNEKYGMLHSSNKRTQCMALLTTTNAIKKKITEKKVSDLPDKLLRSIISDMKSDADFFDSTQSSLYCLNAMINYANMFESKKPKLNMIVEFKNTSLGTLSFNDFSNEGKMIPYDLKAEDVGKTNQLKIINEGAGTVYYKTQLSYSSKADKKVLNHGIALTKLISVERNQKWIPVTEKMELKRGEIIHIDLYVSIPMSRHFVIIDDPIAGGLEPINTDLANAVNVNNAQQSLNNKNKSNYVHFGSSAYSFYHQELKHDRAVFYSTYLPIGDYHVSYNAQVVATGKFTSMPAIAKEMYYPETNGSTKNQEINIVE